MDDTNEDPKTCAHCGEELESGQCPDECTTEVEADDDVPGIDDEVTAEDRWLDHVDRQIDIAREGGL